MTAARTRRGTRWATRARRDGEAPDWPAALAAFCTAAAPDYPDERPRQRGECLEMARPCPFLSCRHHLLPDLRGLASGRRTRLLAMLSDDEVVAFLVDMKMSCALDQADLDGLHLSVVAAALGLTRSRVQQLEARAVQDLQARLLEGSAP